MQLIGEKVKKGCYSVGYYPTLRIYVLSYVVDYKVPYKRYYEITKEDYDSFGRNCILDLRAEKFKRMGVFSNKFVYSQRRTENYNC